MTKSSNRRPARKSRNTKAVSRTSTAKVRDTVAAKVVAKKTRGARKTTPKTFAEARGGPNLMTTAQFEDFRDAQVPDTMRALAETSLAQTREAYERSKKSLQSVLESWQKFGAATQDVVALNQKIFDLAEHNIDVSFDFATSLARAKNLGEVTKLQTAYWRKLFGEMLTQSEEVRALSWKLTKLPETMRMQDSQRRLIYRGR